MACWSSLFVMYTYMLILLQVPEDDFYQEVRFVPKAYGDSGIEGDLAWKGGKTLSGEWGRMNGREKSRTFLWEGVQGDMSP